MFACALVSQVVSFMGVGLRCVLLLVSSLPYFDHLSAWSIGGIQSVWCLANILAWFQCVLRCLKIPGLISMERHQILCFVGCAVVVDPRPNSIFRWLGFGVLPSSASSDDSLSKSPGSSSSPTLICIIILSILRCAPRSFFFISSAIAQAPQAQQMMVPPWRRRAKVCLSTGTLALSTPVGGSWRSSTPIKYDVLMLDCLCWWQNLNAHPLHCNRVVVSGFRCRVGDYMCLRKL